MGGGYFFRHAGEYLRLFTPFLLVMPLVSTRKFCQRYVPEIYKHYKHLLCLLTLALGEPNCAGPSLDATQNRGKQTLGPGGNFSHPYKHYFRSTWASGNPGKIYFPLPPTLPFHGQTVVRCGWIGDCYHFALISLPPAFVPNLLKSKN